MPVRIRLSAPYAAVTQRKSASLRTKWTLVRIQPVARRGSKLSYRAKKHAGVVEAQALSQENVQFVRCNESVQSRRSIYASMVHWITTQVYGTWEEGSIPSGGT